jgi:ParB/RepB/Spo0J family partition protein
VVDQIAAQLNGHMDEAHALIVRPIPEGYQIIAGHHRRLAAAKAGLSEVPCWVREMSDDDAYMALLLDNAQGELTSVEIGIHALGSHCSVKEYAIRSGYSPTSITFMRHAAQTAS